MNYSAKAFVNLDIQTNTWQSGCTYANRYYNAFTYDANGNILTQERHDESGTQIEDLTYNYERTQSTNKMLRNRLYHVNDNVTTAITDDIEDQGVFNNNNSTINTANNYGYDGEGRLIRDDAEEIAQIPWTVTGKVKEVNRVSGSGKKNLKFQYDAMGQRIAKEVYDSQNSWEKTTYYVRDPQGNVIGIYEKLVDVQTQQLSYKITERNIYGNAMVGLIKSDLELIGSSAPPATFFSHTIGEKQYYEQNHLGNILSVVSDVVLAKDWDNDNVIDYYGADIVSISDVYPFSAPMQSRMMNSNSVRHSFNGQEKDDEIYGEGNMTTAEYWQYDARLARRWDLDPRGNSSIAGYVTFASNPIFFRDPNGDTIRGNAGALKTYKEFRGRINARLTNLNNNIENLEAQKNSVNSNWKKKRIQRKIDGLNTVKSELTATNNELDLLEASTQDYVLSFYSNNSSDQGGGTSWSMRESVGDKVYPNAISITINTAHGDVDAKLAHEFKHAYQYETRRTTFSLTDAAVATGIGLKDVADEIEAYQREFYFGTIRNRDNTVVNSITDITGDWVIRRSPGYADLKGTNSVQHAATADEINAMRDHNIKVFQQLQLEVPGAPWSGGTDYIIYKGWQEDAGFK